MTPGSTKGSQTNRFQGNLSKNMLFELMQNQQHDAPNAPQHPQQSKKRSNKEATTHANTNLRQSGSQSSRTPSSQHPVTFGSSGQIKMIKNKKQQAARD